MATGRNLQPGAAVIGPARGARPACKPQERVKGSTDGKGPAAMRGTMCTLVETGMCTGTTSMAGQDAQAPIGIKWTRAKARLLFDGLQIPMADCKGTGQCGRWVVMPLIPQDQQDHTVAPERVDPDLIPDPAHLAQDPPDPIPGDPAAAEAMVVGGESGSSGHKNNGLTACRS
jgi:hypothetical protein